MPALKHGSEVHEQIEQVLKGEREATESHEIYALKIFDELTGIKLVEGVVEGEFDGVVVNGRYDVIARDNEVQTLLDWKTSGKRPAKQMKESTYRQLSLYGYLADLPDGSLLIEAFPEWKMLNQETYMKEDGETQLQYLLDVAREIVLLEETTAEDIPGTPQVLCGWCPYNKICPDRKK